MLNQMLLIARIETEKGLSSLISDSNKRQSVKKKKSLEEANLLSIGNVDLISDLEIMIQESLESYIHMWGLLTETYVSVDKLYNSLLETRKSIEFVERMWSHNVEVFKNNFKIKTIYAYFVKTVLREEATFKELISDNAIVIKRILKRKFNSDNIHHK